MILKKYNICTLIIGDRFSKFKDRFIESCIENTTFNKLIIATDDVRRFDEYTDNKNIVVKEIENIDKIKTVGNDFNYNLKYYALLFDFMFGGESDYSLYFDCDVYFQENIDDILNSVLENFQHNSIYATYTKKIKNLKSKDKFKHKLNLYKNILNYNKYNDIPCIDEVYMILNRKNNSYKKFIDKWKELEIICRNDNTSAYYEGVEIAIASYDSGLKINQGKLYSYFKHN